MKFEYYSFDDRWVDIDKLNLLGDQGWELVTTTKSLGGRVEFIFKREINQINLQWLYLWVILIN